MAWSTRRIWSVVVCWLAPCLVCRASRSKRFGFRPSVPSIDDDASHVSFSSWKEKPTKKNRISARVEKGLLGATLSLTIAYLLLFAYTGKRLLWLQGNSPRGLNTRKLFVMTCMLTSALRVMSFGSMAMLDLGRVDFQAKQSSNVFEADDTTGTGDFFEKASLVLFNFPDFCCISAYVLLLVIWAETYLKSRRHWYSSLRFRKAWMFGYFIFNIILYASQLTIYSMLLLPSVDKYYETSLMYLTLSAFNLVLPIFWLVLYIYLAMVFSGFPFSTSSDKLRLRILSQLGMVWTFARLGWGLIALTSVLRGWLVEASRSRLFYSIVLVAIFFFAEILPVLFSLQENVLQSLSERDLALFVAQKDPTGDNNSENPLTVASRLEADFHRFADHGRNTLESTNQNMASKISPSGYILDTEHFHANEEDSGGLLQHRLLTTPVSSAAQSVAATPTRTSHNPTAPATPATVGGVVNRRQVYQDEDTTFTQNSGMSSWLFGVTQSAPPTVQRPTANTSGSADDRSSSWDHYRTSFSSSSPLPIVTDSARLSSYQQSHSIGSSSPIRIPSINNTTSAGDSRVGSLESARDSYYTASPGNNMIFSPTDTRSTASGSVEEPSGTNFWRSLIGF